MKRTVHAICIILSFLLASCSTRTPLALRHFSHNLIVGKDNSLKLENELIDFRRLKPELVKRQVNTESSIVVHVHQSVSPEVFDALINKLKSDGFKNLSYQQFTD